MTTLQMATLQRREQIEARLKETPQPKDVDIAREFGISRERVRQIRKEIGIPRSKAARNPRNALISLGPRTINRWLAEIGCRFCADCCRVVEICTVKYLWKLGKCLDCGRRWNNDRMKRQRQRWKSTTEGLAYIRQKDKRRNERQREYQREWQRRRQSGERNASQS